MGGILNLLNGMFGAGGNIAEKADVAVEKLEDYKEKMVSRVRAVVDGVAIVVGLSLVAHFLCNRCCFITCGPCPHWFDLKHASGAVAPHCLLTRYGGKQRGGASKYREPSAIHEEKSKSSCNCACCVGCFACLLIWNERNGKLWFVGHC